MLACVFMHTVQRDGVWSSTFPSGETNLAVYYTCWKQKETFGVAVFVFIVFFFLGFSSGIADGNNESTFMALSCYESYMSPPPTSHHDLTTS